MAQYASTALGAAGIPPDCSRHQTQQRHLQQQHLLGLTSAPSQVSLSSQAQAPSSAFRGIPLPLRSRSTPCPSSSRGAGPSSRSPACSSAGPGASGSPGRSALPPSTAAQASASPTASTFTSTVRQQLEDAEVGMSKSNGDVAAAVEAALEQLVAEGSSSDDEGGILGRARVPGPSANGAAVAAPPKTEDELEQELQQRWAHLPEPAGPGPFPEFQGDPETHMWTSPVWASAIDMRRHIFCNRSLNMSSIVAVGFDMDYTLAQYRADTFESLTYRTAVEKLVNTFGYPEELLSWQFDWRYMIRGLVLDKKRGNILKMDRHKYVKVANHGFRPLSAEERRRTYNTTRSRESFDEPDYALIDTLFSIAEAYLFAQLVDWSEAFPHRCPPHVVAPGTREVNYMAMYKNVRSAVDLCHRDGTLKSAVAQDPRKFMHKDDQIVPMLKMLRDSGRKIFLVTNSLWDYTHVVMNCIVGNDGRTPETQRTYEWLKLFDVVITGSAKPGFFMDSSRAPVFEVDVTTGMLNNTDEGAPTAQIGDLPAPPLKATEDQGCLVYQGGSVGHLHRLLSIASGSQVLYVGDHIYGDILRSKKTLGWRTMLVVPELVREVHVLNRTSSLQRAFHGYRHQIDALDDTIQRMAWALRFDRLEEDKQEEVLEEMKSLQVQRDIARKNYRAVMDEWHSHFHPVWGMLMKTGYQNSRFGHQVERFACLYTSHVANLAFYSPDKNFRTVEDFMPHEVDILNC